MKPCSKCEHLTGALAWLKRKGHGGERDVPLCPACYAALDDEKEDDES